jgi:alpha-galactosidase
MDIRVTYQDIQTTAEPIPDFPWVRFDTGSATYSEALIHGRYLAAGWSAMGRPLSRLLVWQRWRPPQEGHAWPGRAAWQSAFSIQIDGQLLNDGWEWEEEHNIPSEKTGCLEHEIVLSNTLRPVEARLHTRLDGTPFLARWIDLTNMGEAPLAIAEACTWSGRLWSAGHFSDPLRVDPAFRLGRFQAGLWGHEGSFAWEPVPRGCFTFDSAQGRSGWSSPFLMLRNESSGEMVIGSLAWSGNWAIQTLLEMPVPAGSTNGSSQPAELYLKAGLSGPPPLKVLEPGESAVFPAFHFGFLSGGLDEGVQAFHEHLRSSTSLPLPPGGVYPVECNHTGYTQNAQITEECLFREVEVAAGIGCELFVVDAGWFGNTASSWAQQVGDWQETPLLKSGLKALFDQIRRKGMRCGLWVEIERMAPTSRIAQEHPEWFVQRRGVAVHQLDLALPEVEQHVYETIARLVETYELDCYRLDYNISMMEGGERQVKGAAGFLSESTMWRYYDALYRIFDRLHARFPGLLLENCSSGGGRTDLGMLSRFHWTQATDQWEPQATLKIVNGMSLSLPPEQVMTLLGAICFDGVSDLDFMLRIGLFGHFCVSGIYPSPEEIHHDTLDRWKHAVSLYKEFVRPMISSSRFYHHTPALRQGYPEEWCVMEIASADRSRALLGAWRLPGAAERSQLLFPRGLNPGLRYRVTYDNSGLTRTIDGGEAIDAGMRIEAGAPGCSELLIFDAF